MTENLRKTLQNRTILEFIRIGLTYKSDILKTEEGKKEHRKIINEFDDSWDLVINSNFSAEESVLLFNAALDRMSKGFEKLFSKYE